ncbi:beta-N-acetylhexosaminidase [Tropicimonas sp.]|uniref:beta-N-acetylhexosaminidase n=1 Tax=Tropicimonas sp. TaxID=2067044 RepID=UPI003A881D39
MSGPGAAIFGCAGPWLGEAERAFFADAQPWGFILFARNIGDPAQLARLTGDLRHAVGRDAPVLIDQEGGRVQRMWAPHWRQWLPPLDQMARTRDLDRAARAMFLRYRLIADELTAVGIDVNCAPTADLARPDTHPFLRNRCFGEDTASVVTGARAAAEGLLAGGVLPVVKHLPGHGRARVDSHFSLPAVNAAPDELNASDFEPFRALADLPLAMTAHIVFTAFDPSLPATQSPRMVETIRRDIGFQGVLMSDDLSMQALAGSVGERAAASVAAGCDLVLHCNGDLAEMEAVAAAAGGMSAEAVAKGEAALALRQRRCPLDMDAAEAELDELLDGEVYAQG